MSETAAIFFGVLLLALGAIPALWCAIVFLVSRIGGWGALSTRPPAPEPVEGRAFRYQSGSVGLMSYRNCLHIKVAPEGLHLSLPFFFRPGHPPLLLPWAELRDRQQGSLFSYKYVQFQAGPKGVRLRIPAKVMEAGS
jgi:hypothetical protein